MNFYREAETETACTLLWACKKGYLVIIDILIQHIDPSFMNNSPLYVASKYGHVDIVTRLLKCNSVNPSDMNNRALGKACKYGHIDVVKVILGDKRCTAKSINDIKNISRTKGHDAIVILLENFVFQNEPRLEIIDKIPETEFEIVNDMSKNVFEYPRKEKSNTWGEFKVQRNPYSF